MEHDNETIDPEGFLLTNDEWLLSNFTGKVKWSSGYKVWYKNGKFHREDGPAIIWPDGYLDWYYDGIRGLENFPPEIKKKLTRKFIVYSS